MSLVGTVCLKLAGRDANRFCVIVEDIDGHFVLIDGDTRRRKVSLKHLKLFPRKVTVSKSSDTAAVRKALQELGVPLRSSDEKKKERAEKKERPVTSRASKASAKKEQAKTETKKSAKKQ